MKDSVFYWSNKVLVKEPALPLLLPGLGETRGLTSSSSNAGTNLAVLVPLLHTCNCIRPAASRRKLGTGDLSHELMSQAVLSDGTVLGRTGRGQLKASC